MKVELEFLKTVPFLKGFSAAELVELRDSLRPRVFRTRDMIQSERDPGDSLHLIRSGRVKVSRFLPNGKETILGFREAGEVFGEIELIDGGESPVTVTAVQSTTTYALGARALSQWVHRPAMATSLTLLLCSRCRDAWHQAELLAINNADARVRAALYQLSLSKGVQTKAGRLIQMRLTHSELSDMAGVTRETVSRILGHLQEERVLSMKTRQFLILDPERLLDNLLVA